MKALALTLLVIVVYAVPPVEGQVPASATRSLQEVRKQHSTDKPLNTHTPALLQTSYATSTEHLVGKPNEPNAIQPIKLSELPPLSLSKDWMDRTAWFFGIVLVVVGILGVRAAYRTLKAIENQAAIMGSQLKAMNDQLGAMQSAGAQTDRLIEQAAAQVEAIRDQAAAARVSADVAQENIEMFISKERARLRVEVEPLKFLSRGKSGADTVRYTIKFYGATDAVILASAHHTQVSVSGDLVHSDHNLAVVFPMDIPAVIGPSTVLGEKFQFIFPEMTLKQTTIDAINRGDVLVHFYGFIKYKDVFGKERETTFNYCWDAGSPLSIQGIDLPARQMWKRVGPPEANLAT